MLAVELEECPICLIEINPGDAILQPDCCNNATHLQCIINWYSINPSKNVCFICQQENEFSKNIVLLNNEADNINTVAEQHSWRNEIYYNIPYILTIFIICIITYTLFKI